MNFDIIVLTECWLSDSKNIPNIDNYYHFSTNDNYNQNDGVVTYIKKNISCAIEEPQFPETNCLLIKIGRDTVILAIYRPHCYKHNVNSFIKSLDSILTTLTSYKNIIIAGDININISQDSSEPYADEYLNLLATFSLFPANTLPTRANSCLDHIIIKTNNRAYSFVLQSSVTDHDPTVICLSSRRHLSKNIFHKQKIDARGLDVAIANIDFSSVLCHDNPNMAASLLTKLISNAIHANMRILPLSRRTKLIKPWMTQGLLRCIRNRDYLHLKLKLTPNNKNNKITYQRYRNFCNNLLKKIKRNYEKSEIEKAGSNNKQLWKTIQTVTNTKKSNETAMELLNICPTPKLSAGYINEYYVNVGKTIAENIRSNSPSLSSRCPKQKRSTSSMAMFSPDAEDIERVLLSLKSNCAQGWDGISSDLLKKHKHLFVPLLVHICSSSFEAGIFPEVFKRSIVLPCYKSGERDRVENYRPISILPSMSKIVEKLMNKNLSSYLENNKLLSEHQYGFRARKSTTDAVENLTNTIVKGLDAGKKVITIFLDLAKAFDTVSIPILIDRLEDLGIRGTQIKLFESYLSDRTQIVRLGDVLSDQQPVTYGIPQGSVVGPTLFLCFINELCDMVLDKGKIISFADDTALIFTGETWVETYKYAQLGLHKVISWLNHNSLCLNANKTKYIAFSIRNINRPPPDLQITAHSCPNPYSQNCSCSILEEVPEIKYLGVVIDRHLNFDSHITKLAGRVRKLMFIFKKLRHIADPSVVKLVYTALCESILSYSIIVWGGASKTNLLTLERAQRAVLKVASFRPFLYPTSELYTFCDVLTVRQLYIVQSLLRQHGSTIFDPHFRKKRRKDRVFNRNATKTSFCQRFSHFRGPYLYNKINRILDLYPLLKRNCKIKIVTWLKKLNYEETEDLLSIPG